MTTVNAYAPTVTTLAWGGCRGPGICQHDERVRVTFQRSHAPVLNMDFIYCSRTSRGTARSPGWLALVPGDGRNPAVGRGPWGRPGSGKRSARRLRIFFPGDPLWP